MYMIDLKIKYSDTITIFESDNHGLVTRLCIVMSEKGIDILEYFNNKIIVNGLVPLDDIRSVINEQFNPEVINIIIL